jgi:hypothetical protein
MKEYRLSSWPELPAHAHRTAHRRILSAMSQRHQTVSQLMDCSGLKRTEVITFVEMLEVQGHVTTREAEEATSSGWRPLGDWLRRAFDGASEGS